MSTKTKDAVAMTKEPTTTKRHGPKKTTKPDIAIVTVDIPKDHSVYKKLETLSDALLSIQRDVTVLHNLAEATDGRLGKLERRSAFRSLKSRQYAKP
jgi:hypothetical protein